MAETRITLQQMGLSRGKALLIGVLALALLGVLYSQYVASDAADPESSAAERTRRRAGSRTSPAKAAPTNVADEQADSGWQFTLAELDQTKWQSPPLPEVIAHDPFALPAAFPQPPRAVVDPELAADGGDGSQAALNAQQLAEAVEQMQRQLQEMQQRGVHVIVNLRDEYVALVGDRTLHVGDEINGFIVTAIEPDGVRVERKGRE